MEAQKDSNLCVMSPCHSHIIIGIRALNLGGLTLTILNPTTLHEQELVDVMFF